MRAYSPIKVQKAAIAALEDIKARDITVLDTRPLTAIYDTLIVATAESARQTKALARHVRDKVLEAGGQVLSVEGEDSGEWVLVDCTEMVVHIMLPTTRALYNLEELWTAPESIRRTKAAVAKPAAKEPVAVASKTATRAVKTAAKAAPVAPAVKAIAAASAAASAAKKPATKAAAATTSKPVAKKPAIKAPAAKAPTVKTPAVKAAVTKAPAAKKTAVKAPAVKKPAVRKPAAKKPAAKAPAVKKVAAKKPAIKAPAAKKLVIKRTKA